MRLSVGDDRSDAWLDDLDEDFAVHAKVAGVDGVEEEARHNFDGSIFWFVDLSRTQKNGIGTGLESHEKKWMKGYECGNELQEGRVYPERSIGYGCHRSAF